jgi:hypothetical protein
MPVSLDLIRVFADAGDLSRLYTAKFPARSLDLIHVAAAHSAVCKTFVSPPSSLIICRRVSRGRVADALADYLRPDVLIADEVPLTYGTDAANVLFRVVNDRRRHNAPWPAWNRAASC